MHTVSNPPLKSSSRYRKPQDLVANCLPDLIFSLPFITPPKKRRAGSPGLRSVRRDLVKGLDRHDERPLLWSEEGPVLSRPPGRLGGKSRRRGGAPDSRLA